MKAKWIKKSLCLLLCLGLATAAMAQGDTSSVLDRVQNVDNPELSELIRLAIENKSKLHKLDQIETMELIRKVTLSYTQVKLFDQQIAEVSRKIEARTGPAEIRYELTLVKTELEAKLMTELANLRELMGIIPKHAFDKKPLESLSSWVILRVLDQGVYVLDCLQPFHGYWGRQRYKSLGLQSRKEALDYVREQLKDPNNLPIRIDFYHMAEMSNAAKNLRGKVVSLVREANCQMEAEVSMKLIEDNRSGESMFFIRGGTISTFHHGGAPLQRPDGGSKHLVTGVFEPNDLDQHILWRLFHPSNVPLKFRIEHDETSSKLARHTTDRVRYLAKDLGIGELVEVERILVETVPESAFLSRWVAITTGEFNIINIQPSGVCVFTMNPGSRSSNAGASVPGRWFLTPKEIIMDIKVRRNKNYLYRGYLDKDGNLVVEKGATIARGRLVTGADRPMVFKKAY
ncbi:MAG TPA: hypothetical protein VMW72_25405 [Sedimentisphaerales bacterium]|nr:hypothetical protein [Sedimentisphaerales bacterium]